MTYDLPYTYLVVASKTDHSTATIYAGCTKLHAELAFEGASKFLSSALPYTQAKGWVIELFELKMVEQKNTIAIKSVT